ncbi:MAG: HAD family hydrolase [Candidatus Obscuribacterales bacterium]|nr:HAD family hydrolase [Candidatus Obscuribacterales bacterium]
MQSLINKPTRNGVQIKLVITDVDGTLSSFWDYFVPAIRDFLRDVSSQVSLSVDELAQDIGHVIERRGTHEYPWLLEETSFAWKHFQKKPDEFVERFVAPFWQALDLNRAKYLRPFPGVLDAVAELKRQGVQVVALSDAPDYMARVRNMQLFDGLLDAVYALESTEPDDDDIFQPITLEYGRKRVKSLLDKTAKIKSRFNILPQSYEKPCPSGLDIVLKDFDVFPQEVLFIGDSLSKDGMVAASRGIKFLWAHYGHQVPAEYEEMVQYSLKPRRADTISRQIPEHLITAVAARYDELLYHI